MNEVDEGAVAEAEQGQEYTQEELLKIGKYLLVQFFRWLYLELSHNYYLDNFFCFDNISCSVFIYIPNLLWFVYPHLLQHINVLLEPLHNQSF